MNAAEKARNIAYIDAALFILGMILMGIFSMIFAFQYNPEEPEAGKVRLLFIGLIVRFVIAGIFQLVMIVLLLEGVLLKNYTRCFIWMVTNRIFLSLMAVSALIKIFLDPISIFAEVIGIQNITIEVQTRGKPDLVKVEFILTIVAIRTTMESVKKASSIVVIDSLILAFAMACALVISGAPNAMVDMIIGEQIKDKAELRKQREYVTTILQIVGAISAIFVLFNILLVMMLYSGTRHKSVAKLRTWYIVNSIVTGLIIFETLFVGDYSGINKVLAKIPNLVLIIYRILTIHFIRKFVHEIKRDERAVDLQQIKIPSPLTLEADTIKIEE